VAVKVLTDSTSYLPLDLRREEGISTVSLSISFESESQREEDVDSSTFYRRMSRVKEMPLSSQPALSEMVDVFSRLTEGGDSCLAIFLSSEMSGTYEGGLAARARLLESNAAAQIEVLDSRSACMQTGYAVLAAARAAKAGAALEEVVSAARSVMARSRFLFVPSTLEYLRKGGRIGGAGALIGSVLRVSPILTVVDGRVEVLRKVRTQARAITSMIDTLFEDVSRKGLGDVVVHHINAEAAGRALAERIGGHIGRSVAVYPIGPVVGLHVGPGAVGFVYYTAG
jgi:DegV family protein with EDD domain